MWKWEFWSPIVWLVMSGFALFFAGYSFGVHDATREAVKEARQYREVDQAASRDLLESARWMLKDERAKCEIEIESLHAVIQANSP